MLVLFFAKNEKVHTGISYTLTDMEKKVCGMTACYKHRFSSRSRASSIPGIYNIEIDIGASDSQAIANRAKTTAITHIKQNTQSKEIVEKERTKQQSG